MVEGPNRHQHQSKVEGPNRHQHLGGGYMTMFGLKTTGSWIGLGSASASLLHDSTQLPQ